MVIAAHSFQYSLLSVQSVYSLIMGTILFKRKDKSKIWASKGALSYAAMADPCVSCTTFNILAPIYKRLDKEDQTCRESQHRVDWLSRNQSIIDRLLEDQSSIVCLQEVWLGNAELVDLYEKRLGDAGYTCLKLARTNNRGDGLLTAIQRDYFRIMNYKELLFNDFGDRVAQLLHIELHPFLQYHSGSIEQQMLVVNTHLLFPHNYSYSTVRLHQVYKILQYVDSYQNENSLNSMPIILCGDWNGSKRGHVYKFLRSQGFVSSYDTAHKYTDSDADAHKWVSHRNHRGNVCGVDFIWLRNPNKNRKPLKTSWNEALLGIIRHLLNTASLTDENAFIFLKMDSNDDNITFSGFCQALGRLGVTRNYEYLSPEELEELWNYIDINGDGAVDFEEFQKRIWNPEFDESREKQEVNDKGTFGFNVKEAALFPPEVEKGTWPDDYYLSDHAPLTVVFTPMEMPCS